MALVRDATYSLKSALLTYCDRYRWRANFEVHGQHFWHARSLCKGSVHCCTNLDTNTEV